MDTTAHDLKILEICHYILGGIYGALALFLLAYGVVIGILMVNFQKFGDSQQALQTTSVLHLMAGMFAGMSLFVFAYAICVLFAGRFLSRRRHYGFCLGVACVTCLVIPFGTVLAVFTFLVLNRPIARAMFRLGPPAGVPPLPVAAIGDSEV